MKLILHAGAHKTGTTMIQQALAKLAPDLAERGVHYVDYQALKEPGVLSYMHPAKEYDDRRASVTEFFARLIQVHRGETLLLSSESFFSFANLWQVSPERQFYGDLAHSAPRFKKLGLFDDITIIYYLRRQDRFLNSVYLEYVKSGVIDVPFEEFYGQVPLEKLSWKRLLETLAAVYGEDRVSVGLFEDIKKGGQRYLADFLDKVGVDIEPPVMNFSAGNRSLPLAAYEEAIEAYPTLDRDARRALGRQLQRRYSGRHLSPAEFMTDELREEIMSPHRRDNLDVLRRFLDGQDPHGYGA